MRPDGGGKNPTLVRIKALCEGAAMNVDKEFSRSI
jgi:hypothetical protein